MVAFSDRSDTYHALFRRLFSDPPRLVTTPLVIAEGHGWFLRRYDQTRALQFLAMIEVMQPLSIISLGSKEQQEAVERLRKHSDQTLTLADALGIWVMETHEIQQCWSTDYHLGLSGVPLIIHER